MVINKTKFYLCLSAFILTIFDAVCTMIGVQNGYITEGNGLMAKLFAISVPWTCAIMILWTGALLVWITAQKFKWIPYALSFVLVLKLIVAAMHITWLSLV
jgi:hypothetical protein